MDSKTCAVCNSNKLRSIEYKNDWSELFNDMTILVCDDCGFGRSLPKIDSKSILDFYQNVYRSKNSPHYVDFSKKISNPYFYRGRSISQLLLGYQYLHYKKKYNFLDIGAGLGKSFISAKEIFNDNVNLNAIEEDKEAKKYYRQHFKDVTIGSSISDFNNIMDIILMSHSLEHFDIDDMQDLFKKIHNAMAENGILIIEVPNDDFRDYDFEKNRLKDTPHLSFFSLESLKKMLETLDFELCFIGPAFSLKEDIYSQKNKTLNQPKIILLLRNVLQVLGLHTLLARWKLNLYLKIRKNFGRDDFHKNINFQYNGNRSVLRCVLRKKSLNNSRYEKEK